MFIPRHSVPRGMLGAVRGGGEWAMFQIDTCIINLLKNHKIKYHL